MTSDINVQCVFNNAGFIVTGFYESAPEGKQMANLECNATAAAKVGWEDVLAALTQVGPSALRELELQVPRVSWDDIGGQHELKQARGRGGEGGGGGGGGGVGAAVCSPVKPGVCIDSQDARPGTTQKSHRASGWQPGTVPGHVWG